MPCYTLYGHSNILKIFSNLCRLKERDDIDCLSDKLLLKIFGNLAADDLLAVGSVSFTICYSPISIR